MTKVDFSKIELEMIDGDKTLVDFQHGENGLPNQIYMQAREIKWKEFGSRLYHADGEVELTDEEVEYIRNHIKTWSLVARQGIEEALRS